MSEKNTQMLRVKIIDRVQGRYGWRYQFWNSFKAAI